MSDIVAFLAWARNADSHIDTDKLLAACDEVEGLAAELPLLIEDVERRGKAIAVLEAENQLLRVALQAIINRLSENDSWLASHLDAANIAREALSKMDTTR